MRLLPEVGWLKLAPVGLRAPWHRVPLIANGRHHDAWRMTALDAPVGQRRRTLVLRRPEDLEEALPRDLRDQWRALSADLNALKQTTGFGNVATLKRAIRLFDEQAAFQDYHLEAFAQRHGAVPALLVGRAKRYRIALMPERLGRSAANDGDTDEELWEILRSHERYLPALLNSYYENIAFYTDAVFFSSPDVRATAFCRRIREIVVTSIRGKRDALKKATRATPRALVVAERIMAQHVDVMNEAEAVDAFIHLIVNYVYRYTCIADRVDDYHRRLDGVASKHEAASSTWILKQCADHIRAPNDRFLNEVERGAPERPYWLQRFLVAGAMVAEVSRFLKDRHPDRPMVFVSYHFEVSDSEEFKDAIERRFAGPLSPLTLIFGRELSENIRWSLFARLWLADAHMLFLPSSWVKRNLELKLLGPVLNWVVRELLFGDRLGRPLTVVTKDPPNEAAIATFRQQIVDYTLEHETAAIPKAGWEDAVRKAKQHVLEQTVSQRYLLASPSGIDQFAVGEFDERVRVPTARHFVRLLLDSWRFFFKAEDWSVVQAIISLCQGPGHEKAPILALTARLGTDTIVDWIMNHRDEQRCFVWARPLTRSEVAERVGSYIKREKGTKGLATFAFRIRGCPVAPLSSSSVDGRIVIHFQLGLFYQRLCEALQISLSDKELLDLTSELNNDRLTEVVLG